MYRLIKLQSKMLGAIYSRLFAVITGALAVAVLVYSYYRGSVVVDAAGAVLIGFLIGMAIITRFWTRAWR